MARKSAPPFSPAPISPGPASKPGPCFLSTRRLRHSSPPAGSHRHSPTAPCFCRDWRRHERQDAKRPRKKEKSLLVHFLASWRLGVHLNDMTIDPIQLELMRNLFEAAADEMGITLQRVAF